MCLVLLPHPTLFSDENKKNKNNLEKIQIEYFENCLSPDPFCFTVRERRVKKVCLALCSCIIGGGVAYAGVAGLEKLAAWKRNVQRSYKAMLFKYYVHVGASVFNDEPNAFFAPQDKNHQEVEKNRDMQQQCWRRCQELLGQVKTVEHFYWGLRIAGFVLFSGLTYYGLSWYTDETRILFISILSNFLSNYDLHKEQIPAMFRAEVEDLAMLYQACNGSLPFDEQEAEDIVIDWVLRSLEARI